MKPKRNIELGDLKAGCKRTTQNDMRVCEECEFCAVCRTMGFGNAPAFWDLTDPPRFTEAQMALLKALWDLGVRSIHQSLVLIDLWGAGEIYIGNIAKGRVDIEMEPEETLDLAELFGKEGTK